MAEVPQHECTGLARDAGELFGIREVSRAVGHVAEQDDGRARADRGAEQLGIHPAGGVDLDPHHARPALGGDPLDEIAVGGEVVAPTTISTRSGSAAERSDSAARSSLYSSTVVESR